MWFDTCCPTVSSTNVNSATYWAASRISNYCGTVSDTRACRKNIYVCVLKDRRGRKKKILERHENWKLYIKRAKTGAGDGLKILRNDKFKWNDFIYDEIKADSWCVFLRNLQPFCLATWRRYCSLFVLSVHCLCCSRYNFAATHSIRSPKISDACPRKCHPPPALFLIIKSSRSRFV